MKVIKGKSGYPVMTSIEKYLELPRVKMFVAVLYARFIHRYGDNVYHPRELIFKCFNKALKQHNQVRFQ